MESKVKVRFAPSPTGHLHIGGVRTALFNWLFAKRENGEFLLRIEDTDIARSEKKYEEEILTDLKWLGLEWDGEITRQSDRLEIYEKYLNELLEKGLAYYCFCTPEELEFERETQLSQGLPPKYGGKCRAILKSDAQNKLESKSAVIRFKIPEKIISWIDSVRGKVEFDMALSGDIVIAKNLKEPLYNFAAAIDDHEMQITHVIRGEDHISNTPKQIAIQETLGFKHPHFAHLPLILGSDKKKLSKRFAESSLNDLENAGFVPQAILNFLVLLGWHPAEDREILSMDEMIKEFDLKRVQKAGAIFNMEKLNWLNAHYIKNMPVHELLNYLKPFIPEEWQKEKILVEKVAELEKNRMKRLSEFKNLAELFFTLPDYDKNLLIWKETPSETILKNLATVKETVEKISEKKFTKENLEKEINSLSEKLGRGEIFWPLRVALSGNENSPGPVEIMDILGKNEALRRLDIAIQKIKDNRLI